jgi:hypothetical protein
MRKMAMLDIIPAEGENVNRIEVRLYYDNRGFIPLTGESEKMGYWLTVNPGFYMEGKGTTYYSTGTKECVKESMTFYKKTWSKLCSDKKTLEPVIRKLIRSAIRINGGNIVLKNKEVDSKKGNILQFPDIKKVNGKKR